MGKEEAKGKGAGLEEKGRGMEEVAAAPFCAAHAGTNPIGTGLARLGQDGVPEP
jgi:hypothetical protein